MRRLLLILAFTVTLSSSTTTAQQSMDGPYVLHEFVEGLTLDAPSAAGAEGESAAPPTAEFSAGEPPALSLETRPGEPIYDKDGPVFERPIERPHGELSPYASANTLDDRTDRVNSLTYFANFDPSIIPYKRVVAKNHAVRRNGEYALEVFSPQRYPVAIEQPPAQPHETFWGTFLLRLERGRIHPIASISPDQRIIEVLAEPNIDVKIERDAADNYFVRADQDGLVRLNLKIAVPSFYFGGAFPDVAWSEFPSGVTPPLDAGLNARSRAIGQRLGFTQSAPPAETLLEMVRYFRDFDARPFPEELRGGDLLEAISTSAIGVCRHRSLAFVFLAQALGIPTRYVYNEAHAFVEVYWPQYGWRRIDLGGAADELNASANDGRPVHNPGDDGLPTPQRFLDEQERMAHNGWEPPGDGSGGRPAGESDDAQPASRDGRTSAATHADGGDGEPPRGEVDVASQADDAPLFEEPPPDERRVASLRILDATTAVRRGQQLRLDAKLTGPDGEAIAGEVEIYLGAVGSINPRAARRIGTARTGRDGRVRTRVDIPREHAIGRWSLFVQFSGNEQYQPVVAD